MAAPTILSSTELTAASRSTNTGSQSVTVPSSCTGIAVFIGGYFSTASSFSGGSVSLSTDGALTATATGGDASSSFHQGACFYLGKNLTSGTQTLSWDWVGTGAPADGALMVVVFIGGSATTTPIRDSDGIQTGSIGDNLLHSTKTLTAQTDDLILAWVEQFAPGGVDPAPVWTNATSVANYDLSAAYRNTDAGLASATPTGNQTVGVKWNTSSSNDGSLQAIVIKPSAGGATKAIAGTVNATSNFSGGLVRIRALSGTVNATSTLSGVLNRLANITGTINATSALSGAVVRIRQIVGTINATSALSGSVAKLGSTKAISGTINALSDLSGGVVRLRALSGSFSMTSSLSGSVVRLRQIVGSFSMTSNLSGTLNAIRSIKGTINSTSNLSGVVQKAGQVVTQFISNPMLIIHEFFQRKRQW